MRSPGLMIRRDLFDQSLARAAEEEGARLLASTRVLRMEEGEVVVRSKGEAGEERVAARVIIGADGPCSTVGRWIGSENRNLIPAVQWRVPLTSPMEHTEVYFHEEFYGGYGWLFPVGREANVGLGRKRKKRARRGESARCWSASFHDWRKRGRSSRDPSGPRQGGSLPNLPAR